MSVLKAVNLTKVYGGQRGAVSMRALDSFNFTVEAGEFVGIMGPSGSGKSTLLNLVGTIDSPTSGQIEIGGEDLTRLKGDALALFRRRRLGFVFQDFNLLDSLTLKENIIIPLALEKLPVAEIEERVAAVAGRLGLNSELNRYPYEVSGGQQQRAAASRALIHQPDLILADEPTGNLDSKSAKALMESLSGLNETTKATILMVTHDPVSASYCRRILFIKDGRLFTELRRGTDRTAFFHQILDVLSALGGESYDGTYTRR
ncbi:MAG TPA: ABC transporter ATP-binding protein [Symbiobacteriaceae bacterium]|nr:ABC transporter ATP-binding protein [Symbiobacteriaceae bacterium]